MDQVLHIRGVSFKVHWTLESVRRPLEAEWLGRGPAMSHALIRYRLSGGEDGPTTFAYTNEFNAPGGRLGNFASHVVVGHAPEREAHDSLMKLKSLVESSVTVYLALPPWRRPGIMYLQARRAPDGRLC